MENDKTLLDIELELETIQAHLKRMRTKEKKIHSLDLELIQDKMRKVYDRLIGLEAATGKREELTKNPVRPVTTPTEEKPETKIAREEPVVPVSASGSKEPPQAAEHETVKKAPEEADKPKEKEGKTKVSAEKPVEEVPQRISPEESVEVSKEHKKSRSTIDLFSDAREETLADKYGVKEDPSIARKMETQKITSLKQAIGINEKFLFINELFGGDLGKYTQTIEEFDNLPTTEGSLAFLRELTVANQWSPDNEAFTKFRLLIERKSIQK